MAAELEGDFSRYPISIRKIFPIVAGEVAELRNYWVVFHYIFADNEKRLAVFSERLGPLLWIFQNLLEIEFVHQIGRLTDKDSKIQKNLSLWSLTAAIPFAKGKEFGPRVESSLASINAAAADVRKHRHKRAAHFDLDTSLNPSLLPDVRFQDYLSILEQMEDFLNLFHVEFEKSETFYDGLTVSGLIDTAELTVFKATAYDLLVSQGKIPNDELEKIMRKLQS